MNITQKIFLILISLILILGTVVGWSVPLTVYSMLLCLLACFNVNSLLGEF